MPDINQSNHKAKKKRSPAYPSFTLSVAIEKAKAVYEADDRHPVSAEALAEHWGTKTSSSAFLQMISTLKQFGLLDDHGMGESRRFVISDLAFDILEADADHPEQLAAAIRTAALKPKIHSELWEKFNCSLPSDTSIRLYLIKERPDNKFNKDSVQAFIAQFRETIAFAKLSDLDIFVQRGDDERDLQMESTVAQPAGQKRPPTPFGRSQGTQPAVLGEFRKLPITLPSLKVAVLEVPFPMSALDFITLTNTLTSFKDALTKEPHDGGG